MDIEIMKDIEQFVGRRKGESHLFSSCRPDEGGILWCLLFSMDDKLRFFLLLITLRCFVPQHDNGISHLFP